jgi:hypothetical protein
LLAAAVVTSAVAAAMVVADTGKVQERRMRRRLAFGQPSFFWPGVFRGAPSEETLGKLLNIAQVVRR